MKIYFWCHRSFLFVCLLLPIKGAIGSGFYFLSFFFWRTVWFCIRLFASLRCECLFVCLSVCVIYIVLHLILVFDLKCFSSSFSCKLFAIFCFLFFFFCCCFRNLYCVACWKLCNNSNNNNNFKYFLGFVFKLHCVAYCTALIAANLIWCV